MNPVLSLYLRQFLIVGIIFGLWAAFSNFIAEGKIDPYEVVFQFIFCGLILSWILVHYHIEQIKNLGFKELSQDILASKQERLIMSNLTQRELIDTIINDQVLGKMYLLKKEHEIILRSGVSFYSLGSTVGIENIDRVDGNHIYKVTSEPRYYIGQADGGKSLKYITQIEKLMTNASSIPITV